MMKLSVTRLSKALFLSTTLAASALSATSVTSDPVGAIYYKFNANADANIGLAVARPSAFEGRIASVDLANNTVTFQGNPGWATNQFIEKTESHYLYIKSGDEEGMHVTVTGNTANSITVFLDTGDRLDRLVVGEVASIVPYWTLDTFFAGQNPENLRIFFCRGRRPTPGVYDSTQVEYTDGAWRKLADGALAGDMAIYPGEGLIARNFGETFDMTIVGTIPMADMRIVFRSNGLTPATRDQRISFFSAAPIPIKDITLLNENDMIATFNPAGMGAYQSWLAFFWGDWYDTTNFMIRTHDFVFEPSLGYSYDGYQNATSEATVFTHRQPYLD